MQTIGRRTKVNNQDGPMPLSQLPDYMKSVRNRGQGEYVPVVDIGRIDDPRPNKGWSFLVGGLLVAACSFAAVSYAAVSTRRISIVAVDSVGSEAITDMVRDEGGRVVSVKKSDDGYEVRVFSFRGIGSLLDALRKNDEIESADLAK